jgi:hypothetical protein
MPTRHPRVQVTLDGELARYVDAARDHVDARGQAGVLRELALRGAKATLAGDDIPPVPARPRRQWVPVEEVAAALAGVPETPGMIDDIRSLPGELTDPFE